MRFSKRRLLGRAILIGLCIPVFGVAASPAISAADVIYANSANTSHGESHSSGVTYNIKGGEAQIEGIAISDIFAHIQTYKPYPGYELFAASAAPSTRIATLYHVTVDGYSSQCFWTFATEAPSEDVLSMTCGYYL